MSLPKKYVDNRLIDWGDALFYEESISQKPRRNKVAKRGAKQPLGSFHSPAKIRAQIARTVDQTPEVMVKITSQKNAGRGMIRIDKHLEYISRNGKLEIELDDGDLMLGRADLMALKAEWRNNPNGVKIPEVSQRREAFNVIFSMQAGTPAAEVREAVKDFLTEEFAGKHRYAFVLHTDRPQPHVHVCIQAAPKKRGHRLNPRKNDLQRWREGFAQKLRDRGIAANATSQKARGTYHQNLTMDQYLDKRSGLPFKERRLSAADLGAYRTQNTAWRQIHDTLRSSEDPADHRLAEKINEFGKSTPIYRASVNAPTGTQQPTRKERTHGKGKYNKVIRAAALYQSGFIGTQRQAAAKSIDGMRKLSDLNVVRNKRTAKKLLSADARDRMGRRSGKR